MPRAWSDFNMAGKGGVAPPDKGLAASVLEAIKVYIGESGIEKNTADANKTYFGKAPVVWEVLTDLGE